MRRWLGVGWRTAWSAIREAAEEVVGHPDWVGPAASVGFDKTVMASANRRCRFTIAVVDSASGQIVDVF